MIDLSEVICFPNFEKILSDDADEAGILRTLGTRSLILGYCVLFPKT